MPGQIVQKAVSVSAAMPIGIAAFLRDLVFPPSCAHCHCRTGRHGGLCPRCWSSIRFIERPFCDVLGTSFSHDPGPGMLSAEAIANPPVFDRLRSVAVHEGIARDLVHDLKYRDRTDLAPMMARWMARAGAEALSNCDVVVSVPLHRTRLFSRKFNQSAELARNVAREWKKPFLPLALVRNKKTAQQVGLTANARTLNVRGAFIVPDAARAEVFGRRIVLVDDVFTTGATVSAATRALKKAGAREVSVLTFARVFSGPI
ncbi:MAG: ComF family protein [Rhizobium sp.]|nr:ComF family protein [Rhizobium sp.]